MKVISLLKKLLIGGLLLFPSMSVFPQILVSGTDFECKGKSENEYGAVSDLVYTGIMPGTVDVYVDFPKDVDYEFKNKKPFSSHFHDKSQYAITSNPIILDSLHYVDDKKSGWGIVFSPARVTENKTLLEYSVGGLTPNSTATVVIEYRSVVDEDLLTTCGGGSARAQFKAAINADQYNLTQGSDVPQLGMGEKNTYKDTKVKVTSEGIVDIRINATSGYSSDCHAFEITKIEVYGDISPKIICTDGDVVCAGEFANLFKSGVDYEGAKYQWYMNGSAVAGATSPNYTYETPSTPGSYTFQLYVTYENKTYKSNIVEITSEKCCEIVVDGVSVPASRKIIFHEDFGEFDLSDKTGGTYKVWDYSDIANPVQLTKSTTSPFRYALDNPPLGCKFEGGSGKEVLDGYYTVAGVLTGYNPVQGMVGAKMGWANRIGGKKTPPDLEYDHSGKLEGCALFVNCNPHTAGKNIYEREIDHLCQNRQLFFECYFSVFTNSASGQYNPVDITARLSEVGNPTNVVEMKGTATREEDGGTGTWVKLSSQIFLEKTDAVFLEIINNSDVSENGNDLVLDDIIIRACAAPSLQAYFDINTFDIDTFTCSNENNGIEVYAKPSDMLTKYFGGDDKARFLYQWSITPDVKTSWKSIGTPTTDRKYKVGATPFAGVNDGDVVYFRVIAGSEYTLTTTAESAYNADDPCASYTISDAIPCVIDCPTCTESKKPVINPNGGGIFKNKILELCRDDKTTLSTNDVTVIEEKTKTPYTFYTITWTKDGAKVGDVAKFEKDATTPVKAEPLDISWSDATETGTQYIVTVHDRFEDEKGTKRCDMTDTITVIAVPTPVGRDIVVPPFCENDLSRATILKDSMSKFSDYDITWYKDDQMTTVASEPDVASAEPSDEPYVYYYTLTNNKGCVSDVYSFTFTVKEVPSEILSEIPAFCEYINGAKSKSGDATDASILPVSTKGYTVDWYNELAASTSAQTDLSSLSGSLTPYTYYYTLTKDGCTSNPAAYNFTVKPLASVSLVAVNVCDKTTLRATPIPTDATVTWNTNETGSTLEFVEPTKAGLYSAVATANGYCASESVEINADFYATPIDLVASPVSLLKINAPFGTTELLASIAESSKDPNATIKWMGQFNTQGEPTEKDGTLTPNAPKVQNDDTNDEKCYYYVYQEIKYATSTCMSGLTEVLVNILGAPAPNTTNVMYCLKDDPASLSSLVEKGEGSEAGKNYEFLWYLSENQSSPESAVPTISTATTGLTTYYVSQREVGTLNESAKMPLTVTVYDAPKPVTEATINYCKGDAAAALSADYTYGLSTYTQATGYKWYDANDFSSESAMIPSTDVAGTQSYKVSSTYKLPDGSAVCESEKSDITVNVYETLAPDPATIQYIKADADANNVFPALTTKPTWEEETGYTYYYSAVSESDVMPQPVSDMLYSSVVPTPKYDVSLLSGGTKNLYCWVYRVDNSNPKACNSEPVLLTIKISDALPPAVKNVYVCEGSAVPDLQAEVQLLPGSTKTASDYTLIWYGTTDPNTNPNAQPDKEGVSTYSTGVTSAAVTNNAKTEYKYYVTQKDNDTKAESAASEIIVTVLPKPILDIKALDPTCEKKIDISTAVTVVNAAECGTVSYVYTDGSGNQLTSTEIAATDIYKVTPSYAVSYSGDVIIADASCTGVAYDINAEVDSMDVPTIAGPTQACPGESGVQITASVEHSTFASSDIRYKWSDQQSITGGANSLNTFPDEPGAVFTYTVTAYAGVCEKTSEVHTITVGDGQVKGSMTVTEDGNQLVQGPFVDVVNREFYSCGGDVTIKVDYEKTEGDYEWYKNGQATGVTGPNYKITSTTAVSHDIYEVRFVNKCDASASITVHTIPLTVTPETGAEQKCEKESFSTSLNIVCSETPVIQWMLNGNDISGANAAIYSKSNLKEEEDDGQYSYIVTNRGCVAKDNSKSLDVQKYIEMEDLKDPIIVARGADQTIQLIMNVPSTQTVKTVDWQENNVSVQNSSSISYTEHSVVADHEYTIYLSDPDYCKTSTTATIWVDAELQLTTILKDTICLGLSTILEIDTTGTGRFRQAGVTPQLKVVRSMGGEVMDVTSELKKVGDKLQMEVSPTEKAVYTITFDYGSQHKESIEEVFVIEAISLTLPDSPTLCEGESVTLTVGDVQPEGTTVSWEADPTITGTNEGETITVEPTYTGGTSHRGTYTYTAIAYNAKCNDSKRYEIPVYVDEALKGEIQGSEVICEGDQGRINASSYDAASYVWNVDTVVVGTGSALSVYPRTTTTYELKMERGTCKAEDSYELKVTSLPVITSVDSIGVRDRSIETEKGKGTGTFYYWVDVEASIATNNVVYNLTFGKHVAYVRDENGCKTSMPFVMEAPEPEIPDWFSPNGDGINDGWVIGKLAEVYPDAKIWIYDRFGKLMIELKGSDTEGWNGTYNGTPMPSTDYWYVVDIEEIDKQYTGHFTLIRQ